MSIDTDTVRKVAHLARIAVREDELAPLAAELNSILDWVERPSSIPFSTGSSSSARST